MALYLFAAMLNFTVNILLILAVNQTMGEHSGWKRIVPAAALGGVYAGVCLRWYALGNLLWRLCALGCMSKIAFGRAFAKRGLLFLVLQLAVSGVAAGLHSSGVWSVVVTVLWISAMCLSNIAEKRSRIVPVELTYGSKTLRIRALWDTGNTLRDPLTGRPVLVVGADVAAILTGLTQEQLRRPVDTIAQQPVFGLRLIPYRTIDTPDGMLLGIWIKEAVVGKRKGGALVAFAPETLSEDGSIQGLTGG